MKHASFFSGVGGLDLGFERAGIETVSVSEIDPYANTVLAERFPSAPNLGSITEVNANDIPEADIWSGGFPCQDLSVAGKRAGFAGKRSSLAFTFLDLVEQRRPRWLVLENVPGLFSSNGGADFGRLLYEMDQLRYGVSWRTLDARYFGVAQRRRRVFLVASLESDRAGEVLFECEGCERHPSPRWTQRQGVASGTSDGSGINQHRTSSGSGASPDTDRVRKADGLARRLDDQSGVARKSSFGHYEMTQQAGTLKSSGGDIGGGSENLAMTLTSPQGGGRRDKIPMTIQAVIQDSREMAHKGQNGFGVSTEDISYTLTGVDQQAVATESILSFPSRFGSNANVTDGQAQSMAHSAGAPAVLLDREGGTGQDDPLLPLGLDSHRYRCCGNGVVAPVAEWIGRRIVEVDRRWREEVK